MIGSIIILSYIKLCQRTENRSRKTHVFEYRDCGVGWGGMLTFLVLRRWYIAMLLRSLGSFTTLHVAMLLMGWGGMLTFLVLCQKCHQKPAESQLPHWHHRFYVESDEKSIPSNLSAKSDLLMVYARAWQWRCIHKNADCQLITVHALQRWPEKPKNAPQVFPGFPIIKSAWHCGKITIVKKKTCVLWARFPVRRENYAYNVHTTHIKYICVCDELD